MHLDLVHRTWGWKFSPHSWSRQDGWSGIYNLARFTLLDARHLTSTSSFSFSFGFFPSPLESNTWLPSLRLGIAKGDA
jgi:hypothetical protein